MSKRWSLQQYKLALKRIRPFTKGFLPSDGYDIRNAKIWSNSKKGSIRRYYEMLNAVQSNKSTYHYRPRKKANLEVARQAIGAGSFKKLVVIPIETRVESLDEDTGEPILLKPEITIGKDKILKVKLGPLERHTINIFEQGYTEEELVQDPIGVYADLIEKFPYERYSIIAGEFEVKVAGNSPMSFLPEDILPAIQQLINAYPLSDKNHSYDQWLFGLKGFKFNNYNQVIDWKKGYIQHARNKVVINKKIKDTKARIEKRKDEISTINRSKNLRPKFSRIIHSAINEDIKQETDQRRIINLKKLKKLTTQSLNKNLPRVLRDYILSVKREQIRKLNIRVNNLIISRTKI